MPSARPTDKTPLAVFVADDSDVARLTLTRKLRAEGFDVVEQASAEVPMDAVLPRLACALLDLDLGDGDGRELARALRASRADLPIAFFSASSSVEALASARALGPVFAKGDPIDQVIAWVRTAANTER